MINITLESELSDKIRKTLLSCDAHNSRMNSALLKLGSVFPLDKDSYLKLDDQSISLTDQLILRYLKLQDLIGKNLFPMVLLSLQEDFTDRPMIDILNRLEQLHILNSAQQWIELREVRNILTHDYPHLVEETVEGLNLLADKARDLSEIYLKIKKFVIELQKDQN